MLHDCLFQRRAPVPIIPCPAEGGEAFCQKGQPGRHDIEQSHADESQQSPCRLEPVSCCQGILA